MTGQMDLADRIEGHSGEVVPGVEAQVVGADVDVVHVQQQPAPRTPHGLGHEIRMIQLGTGKCGVHGRVLDHDLTPGRVLEDTDVAGQGIDRFLRAGQGQQVVQTGAANLSRGADPGNVIGQGGWAIAAHQVADAGQVLPIRLVNRSQ